METPLLGFLPLQEKIGKKIARSTERHYAKSLKLCDDKRLRGTIAVLCRAHNANP